MLMLLATALAAALVMLHAGFSVSVTAIYAALPAAAFFLIAISQSLSPHAWRRVAGSAGLIIVLSILISFDLGRQFWDLSGDGQWYHQEAIYQIADGWSIYAQAPASAALGDGALAMECFSKGAWILDALAYRATGNVESGKAVHFLLGFSAQLLAWGLFVRLGIRFYIAGLLALVAVWNSVMLVEVYSFYLDGDLSSAMVAFIAASILSLSLSSICLRFVAAAALFLLVSIKLTGIPYAFILLGGLILIAAIYYRSRAVASKLTWISVGLFAGLILEPTALLNWYHYGHPFYPIMGNNPPFGEMAKVAPRNLKDMNGAGQLVLSILGQPELAFQTAGTVRYKAWFRVTGETLLAFRHWPDPNIAGYGVLIPEIFSGTLLLLLLSSPYRSRKLACVAVGLAIILFMVLCKPRIWYARYNPQLLYIPIIVLAFHFCSLAKTPWEVARRSLAYATLALLLLNSIMIGRNYLQGQRELTTGARAQVAALRSRSKAGPIPVYFFTLRTNRFRLEHEGVEYKEVLQLQDLPCAAPREIFGMHLSYCPQ